MSEDDRDYSARSKTWSNWWPLVQVADGSHMVDVGKRGLVAEGFSVAEQHELRNARHSGSRFRVSTSTF